MLDAAIKRQAYAAMDDAAAFRLDVVPAGVQPAMLARESAIHLLTTDSVEAMREPVKLLAHLARTFFSDKLTGVTPAPKEPGSLSLFVVCELTELDEAYLESLSEEGNAPRMIRPPSGAETLRIADQDTLRLPSSDDDGWSD